MDKVVSCSIYLAISWDELTDEFLEVADDSLTLHDLNHLLADVANLGGLGVRSLLGLVLSALGEPNAKETESVTIGGLDVYVGFYESLPLAHQRAELVSGKSHTVEVGKGLLSLDGLNLKLEETEGLIFTIGFEISERDLVATAHQTILGELGSGSLSDNSLSDLTDGKRVGGLDIVPFLLGERVNSFASSFALLS